MKLLKTVVSFVLVLFAMLLLVTAIGAQVGPIELLLALVLVTAGFVGLPRLVRLGREG